MFGLFKKFKDGFSKTVSAIAAKTQGLFGGRKIDASSLDELEEALITADFGVETTEEILTSVRTTSVERRLNHSVALAKSLDLPEADLLVSPYVLGAWLGAGTTVAAAITTADAEMVMFLEAEGLKVTTTSAPMRYALKLPVEGVLERKCVVCGASFLPATSQVKTCGRSCGGRSRGLGARSVARCPA